MRTDPVLPFVFGEPVYTERLILRLMTPADVDDVHAYQSREDVCKYELHGPRTREDLVERIAVWAKATTLAANDDYWELAIELPAADGADARLIGELYFKIADLENSRGEIGWTVHPDFQRSGYATEAATAVLELAFGAIGLHRVIADLDPQNDASIALCKRLGMREEAHFVKDIWVKGEWSDTGIYAILRDEWLSRP